MNYPLIFHELFLIIRGKFVVIRVLIREEFWPVASDFREIDVLKALFYTIKFHKNIDFLGINSEKIIIFLEYSSYFAYFCRNINTKSYDCERD